MNYELAKGLKVMNKKIFCIIPAFNEEEKIAKVIKDVFPFFDKIIIVDDGSFDNTYKEAKKSGVVVLRHLINRGQGAALETGNQYALKNGVNFVVHFDADGQFLSDEINDVLEPLKDDKYDIVFGSRFLGKKNNMPFFKKNILFPVARLINLFLGVKTTDPQSGFRAMNRKALEKIKIKNDGSAHCSEILSKAFKFKLKIKEIPITVLYDEFGQGIFGGKGKGSGGIKIIKDLIIQKIIE